jgi:lysophospholipase L1-like esterase
MARAIFLWAGICLVCCLVATGLAEVVLRSTLPPSTYQLDAALGWRTVTNAKMQVEQRDAAGNTYDVLFETDAFGRRTYHVTGEGVPIRLLITGDSYTSLPYAADGEMWFAAFARALSVKTGRGVSVTAVGAGGYGTLQELALAQEEADRGGAPDIYIHQFCGNDFMNNTQKWEEATILTNLFGRRPFLNDDLKTVTFASDPWSRILRSPLGESRLLSRLDQALQLFRLREGSRYRVETTPLMVQGWQDQAKVITQTLLGRLRGLFPNAVALMVNCSGPDEYFDFHRGLDTGWENMGQAAGFYTLAAPAQAIAATRDAGLVVNNADLKHFNRLGNQVFGEALFESSWPLLSKVDLLTK